MATSNNILITGASGLIGTRLTELLLQRKDRVSHLGRMKKDSDIHSFTWDVKQGRIDAEALNGVDTIVHLAGASVGDKRWTEKRKREILESRTKSTHLLYETLKKNRYTVKVFVTASGMSYYGYGDETRVFTESAPPANDFLARVVQQWEAEADKISELGIRVVKLRTGLVLSQKGGALKELVTPVKFFVGAPLGSGKQLMSWIHIDDLCGMFIKAIDDPAMSGAYNATGAYAVSNREMTNAIAKVLGKPVILPFVPSFVLKMILGEMAEMVLKGSQVSSDKIVKAGFHFKFNRLEDALEDLLAPHP
jgi:uncharacterized protein (TIGR01777 family)